LTNLIWIEAAVAKQKDIVEAMPSSEGLTSDNELVRVTIYLSKSSVDFFKREARANRTQYQKMIRNLLDLYAASQSLKAPAKSGLSYFDAAFALRRRLGAGRSVAALNGLARGWNHATVKWRERQPLLRFLGRP